jgi:hypothetical protein
MEAWAASLQATAARPSPWLFSTLTAPSSRLSMPSRGRFLCCGRPEAKVLAISTAESQERRERHGSVESNWRCRRVNVECIERQFAVIKFENRRFDEGEKTRQKDSRWAMGQDAQARGKQQRLDALSPFHQPTSSPGSACSRGPCKIQRACVFLTTIPKSDHGGMSLKTDRPPSGSPRSRSRTRIHRRRRQRGTISRIEDPPVDLHPASQHLLDANSEDGGHDLPLNLPLTCLGRYLDQAAEGPPTRSRRVQRKSQQDRN